MEQRTEGIYHLVPTDGYLDYYKKVHISMFDENRKKVVHLMKSNNPQPNSILFFQGGKDFHRYDTDVDYNFKQESFFAYLFAINEPNCYGAIDMTTGESILFVPRLSDDNAVWTGPNKSTEFYKNKYGVNYVYYVDEITQVLEDQNTRTLYLPKGVNMYSGRENEPVNFDGIESFEINNEVLMPILCEARVIKSDKELDLMRFVNDISSTAHIHVMKNAKRCSYEYELESDFLHYINKYYGCRHVSYGCICCSAHNGATLHYGHASAPNDRKLQQGDMLLLDMGAEYYNYGSDITCSFPLSGKFTENQKLIYNAVLDSQLQVEKLVRSGVSWYELQRVAELVIIKHLVDIGIVISNGKSLEDLVDVHEISRLFMPHGFGHLLGMDVHDVDSHSPLYPLEYTGEENGIKLRSRSLLRKGMVITVEPGIYFNEVLLLPALEDEEVGMFLNKERILSEFINFGGVRLEDDVIVGENDCEVITRVPRTIDEIEKCMLQALI